MSISMPSGGKDTMAGEDAVRHMSRELYQVGAGGFPAHDHERLGGGYPQRRGRHRRGDGTP